MLVSYPALFYKEPEGGYFINFPDFEYSGTQGEDISDAMFMASDWLGNYCVRIYRRRNRFAKS